MATLLGSLLVSLGLESGQFKSGLTEAQKEFRRAQRSFEQTAKSMQSIGTRLSLAVTAPIILIGKRSFDAAMKSKEAFAQVERALDGMGGASGKTAEDLKKSSKELETLSNFDQTDILNKVTKNLLTFGNVSGEVFDRAQQAAVDLSEGLQQDLQSSALQLGKALNDPIKGITALSRAGVSFSPAQQEVIKSLVKTGEVAKAQGIILDELSKQFGGAAKAARDATPGGDLQQAWRELQRTIGEALIPAFAAFERAVTPVIQAFTNLSPEAQRAIIVIGGLAAALGPLLVVLGFAIQQMAPFLAAVKLVGAAGGPVLAAKAAIMGLGAAFGPMVLAVGAAIAIGVAFARNWDLIAPVLENLWATAQETIGRPLQDLANQLMELFTELWEGPLGSMMSEVATGLVALAGIILQTLGPPLLAIIGAAIRVITFLFQMITAGVSGIGALLRGDWIKAWAGADSGAARFLESIRKNILLLLGPIGLVLRGLQLIGQREKQNRAKASAGQDPFDPSYARGLLQEFAGDRARKQAEAIQSALGAGGGGGGSPRPSRSGRATPKPEDRTAEIERKFNNDLVGLTQQILSARSSLATDAEERAELEMRKLEWNRRSALEEINLDKDYNEAQKAELAAAVERLADFERESIERDLRRDVEREISDLTQVEFDAKRELLFLQKDITDTQAGRKALATQILDLEQEYRRNMLEMVLASQTASDAEKRRAQAILDSLGAIEQAERSSTNRQFETDVERFLRSVSKTREEINEDIDRIKMDGLQSLSDGLVDVIMGFQSLGKTVKRVAQQILSDLLRLQLQQMILKPLAGAIGLGVPAFARGTNFAPGGMALVGEMGPELVNLPRGSQVIPNNQIGNAMRGSGGASNTFVWNVQTPNADSFNRSSRQMQSAAKKRLGQ
jgi:hypothetical protein